MPPLAIFNFNMLPTAPMDVKDDILVRDKKTRVTRAPAAPKAPEHVSGKVATALEPVPGQNRVDAVRVDGHGNVSER